MPLWIYIYIYTGLLVKWVECSPMTPKIGVQFQVESYLRIRKWYLTPLYLTLSIIRYGSRVKLSNPGKGEAPSPTLRIVANEKGTSTINYGR